ncbi:hypothetical protein [Rahnella inusitata]|uniref:hypothetical protein n=1 Tax=Rahnella inusitata TaxID=58169 RepID=UPI0039B0DBF6
MSLMLLCKGIIGLETLTGRARKSAAEWCFLISCLFIVPLLIFDGFSVPVKILLQLCWAVVVVRAAFLASETWKKNRK